MARTRQSWTLAQIRSIPLAERTAHDYVWAITGGLGSEKLSPKETLRRAYALVRAEEELAAFKESRAEEAVGVASPPSPEPPSAVTMADLLRMAATMMDELSKGNE